MSVSETLGSAYSEGFERAYQPRELIFPDDHGAHDTYKNEWWYFTGNVATAGGRTFGYQFTLFRSALAPEQPPINSAWATNQIYLTHVALSDIHQDEFLVAERFSRGALDLAGADAEPFRIWLDDWSVSGIEIRGRGQFSVMLKVETGSFSLDIELDNSQSMVLHGDQGLSAKSSTPGNASYYYSFPRLQTDGVIGIGVEQFPVSGESWFDHEWSTSALEAGQTGWDWFSLQLSDQSALMLFQLRHAEDPRQNFYSGTLIQADGTAIHLQDGDFSITEQDTWQSPTTGVVYPAGWEIILPDYAVSMTVIPAMADQEMRTSFRYWEGAVTVTGIKENNAVSGKGYVELTGYQ
jgi:predicted secreted hydrolase